MIHLPRRSIVVLVVLALALLVGAGVIVQAQTTPTPQTQAPQARTALCSASYCADWHVLAGGLGPMESASFRVESTLGQTMAGLFSGSRFNVEAGYWTGVNRGDRIYIPITIR